MTRRVSKSGFTLLEVLVASMLLGMLITILTMVFNSSSIAWSTGKAGVVDMNIVRKTMSAAEILADNAIPRVNVDNPQEWGVLVSPWDAQGKVQKRAVTKMNATELGMNLWDTMTPQIQIVKGEVGPGEWNRNKGARLWAAPLLARPSQTSDDPKAYVVGVWSLGPDGKENSGDDISTWPDLD